MDKGIVNELLNCYVATAKCSLYNVSSSSNTPPTTGPALGTPYPQYVGVSHSQIPHSYMIGNLLTYLTGKTVDSINETSQYDCESMKDNIWNYYYAAVDTSRQRSEMKEVWRATHCFVLILNIYGLILAFCILHVANCNDITLHDIIHNLQHV